MSFQVGTGPKATFRSFDVVQPIAMIWFWLQPKPGSTANAVSFTIYSESNLLLLSTIRIWCGAKIQFLPLSRLLSLRTAIRWCKDIQEVQYLTNQQQVYADSAVIVIS